MYRIERIRVATMWRYCRQADRNVPGYDSSNALCNYNSETNKPRWRVTKKGELAPHPREDHFRVFNWSDDKEGQDFPLEEEED